MLKGIGLGVRSERDGLNLENLVNGVKLRSTQKISKVNFWVFPWRINSGKKEEIHHRLPFFLLPGYHEVICYALPYLSTKMGWNL